jgi:hypothetical protein
MSKSRTASVLATALLLAGARTTFAQTDVEVGVDVQAEVQAEVDAQPPSAPPEPYAPPPGYQAPPAPPNVESAPAPAAAGGGYCYGGPHPTDTRVEAGPPWDETQGNHLHQVPPFDLRLFVLRNGCYHFVGDPTDFGYRGTTYSYYGAHPVLDLYGGGWCFMIGGHAHWWRPWSPYFTIAGPWYYWYGAYDPFFWSHWPYYAHYYRAYYPRYYGGGRFYRGSRRDRVVAPPVGRMAAGPARAMPSGGGFSSPRMGGAPAPVAPTRGSGSRTPGWSSPAAPARVGGDVPSLGWSTRPGPTRQVAPVAPTTRGNRGFQAAPGTTFTAPAPRGGFQGDPSGWSGTHRAPAPTAPSSGFRAPAPAAAPPANWSPSYRSAPAPAPSAGWGGSFRSAPAPSAPSGGSFRSAPSSAPSFRSAPSSPSSAPSFRGGGGGGGWRSGGGSGGGGGVRWR